MKIFKPLLTMMALACLSVPAMAEHAHDHGAAAPATDKNAPIVGQAAPDFSATDIDGKAVKLADLKGKIVVLEWNNPECPFVLKHYDTKNMQALQTDATGQGVVWLIVNSSAEGQQGSLDNAKAKAYIEKVGAKPSHYILDPKGEIGQLYQAKTTPHMFVIDKEGVLAYAGAIDDNPTPRHETVKTAKNYVAAAISALSEGRKVEVATSQPYGCGVKYSTN